MVVKLPPTKEAVVEAAATTAAVATEVETAEVVTPPTTHPAVEAAVDTAAAAACQEVVDMAVVAVAAAATKATGREVLEKARSKAQTIKSRSARTSLTDTASMATLAHSHMVTQI